MGQQYRHYLKEWREYLGKTQDQLGTSIGYSHRSGYGRIENERKNLTYPRLLKIAEALEINPGELFFPPPTDTRTQLERNLRELNEQDLEAVASLVRTLLQQERRRA